MKKIGIVTWFGGSNYGTSLQAYALCAKIEELGASPYLLKRHITWRNIIGNIIRSCIQKKLQEKEYGYGKKKKKKILSFKKNKFKQFPLCFGFIGKQVYKWQVSKLSCIIAGSDQLWNPYHTSSYLLLKDFKTNKYSYASSIGVKKIPKEINHLYIEALKDFKLISVREESAIVPLQELSGKQITKVVDPTFLLVREQWVTFSNGFSITKFDRTTPYILCYFIANQEEYWYKLEKIRATTQIDRVVVLPMHPSHFKRTVELVEDAGINDFVFLLNNARLICTDSFHATALSINLEKDFITMLRFKEKDVNSQNSRLENLLNRYNLSNRLYVDRPPTLESIDYSTVQVKLTSDRELSISYLKSVINAC